MDVKANEFVKKFGWNDARVCVLNCSSSKDRWLMRRGELVSDQEFDELKRLVESHELIESCGGLESVGEKLTHGMYESRAVIERLKQAILDVESCQ